MTFSEFLRKEHQEWIFKNQLKWSLEDWLKSNKPSHWIELATRWHEESLPSLQELKEYVSKSEGHYHVEDDTWFCCSQCSDCADDDRKGKPCDCCMSERSESQATALRKFLEERIK